MFYAEFSGFRAPLGNSEDSSNLSPFPAGFWSQLVCSPPCDRVLQPGQANGDTSDWAWQSWPEDDLLIFVCIRTKKSSHTFLKVWSWEFWWYQWYPKSYHPQPSDLGAPKYMASRPPSHRHPVTLHNWHVGLNYDRLSNLSNCEILFFACIHWFWLPCKLPSLFGPAWNIEWDRW